MTTIDSLPPELLDVIFGQETDIYQDLPNLALVCHRWRDPAQRAVFSRVGLSTLERARSWLHSPARHLYPAKGIVIESDWWLDNCSFVLEACPNLLSLSIRSSGAPSGRRDVDLDGGYGWCQQTKSDLKTLSLAYPENFPHHAEPLPFRLRHLQLDADGGEESKFPPNVLPSIFSSSLDSLTSLHLIGMRHPGISSQLCDFFSHSPLASVRLLILDCSASFEHWPKLLATFPSLETLEIHGVTSWGDRASVRAVGASATPTLTTLVLKFKRIKQILLQDILNVMKLPGLVGLRRLELPRVPMEDFKTETGLALLDECEARSVSLRCRYGHITRDECFKVKVESDVGEIAALNPTGA